MTLFDPPRPVAPQVTHMEDVSLFNGATLLAGVLTVVALLIAFAERPDRGG